MPGILSNIVQYFKNLHASPFPEKEMPLSFSLTGFSFPSRPVAASTPPTLHKQLHWADVDGIATWKYDNFAYDEIVVGFHCRNSDDWIVVSEQQPGFVTLMEQMGSRFPGIPDSWYSDVMIPVFEPKLTLLYGSHRPWPEDDESANFKERQ